MFSKTVSKYYVKRNKNTDVEQGRQDSAILSTLFYVRVFVNEYHSPTSPVDLSFVVVLRERAAQKYDSKLEQAEYVLRGVWRYRNAYLNCKEQWCSSIRDTPRSVSSAVRNSFFIFIRMACRVLGLSAANQTDNRRAPIIYSIPYLSSSPCEQCIRFVVVLTLHANAL